jgi:hypothetical protein
VVNQRRGSLLDGEAASLNNVQELVGIGEGPWQPHVVGWPKSAIWGASQSSLAPSMTSPEPG